ncbi:MAG: hypothetical protein NTV31_17365 [Bacteroidia bacterium]|nr:hypothetical protein [Bacteroidia bacterium]
MKRAANSAETTRNLDLLISKLSENELLNLQAMSYVRGGDPDEGNGSVPINIIPPHP